MRKLLLVLVLASLAGLIAYGFRPRPVPVETAAVSRGPLKETVEEDGRTRVRNRYVLSAPVTGQARRPTVKAGDAVQAGAVLVEIDSPQSGPLDARTRAEAEARLRAAEAAVEQAVSAAEQARALDERAAADMARAEELGRTGVATRENLETAALVRRSVAAARESAKAAVRVAEFQREQARAILSPAPAESSPVVVVTAPVAGRVLRVHQESAGPVAPGQRLLEIGDPSDLEVEIDVLSSDAARIQPGAEVEFDHWGGEGVLRGRVRVVEPSAFLKLSALGIEEQRVNLITDLLTPVAERPALGDGFRVEARVTTWESANCLRVPAGALFREGLDWAVFSVTQDQAHLRRLAVGRQNADFAEVREGLAEGDLVILHPADTVREGVRLRALGTE